MMAHAQKPRFVFRAKRTSPFKSAGASVQSTVGSRGVRISGSNAGYTMFRGSVKSTGYPLHSPVSPSLPLPCVTACHHISIGLYQQMEAIVYFMVFGRLRSLTELSDGSTNCRQWARDGCLLASKLSVKRSTVLM